MSYDIQLNHQVTGEVLELDTPHQMKGGTYQVGGCDTASMNITYNYGNHFYRVFDDDGIRDIYGKTGVESIPILESAISKLKDDVSSDYWESTEGNAKASLIQLLTLAKLRPDGIWDGD